MIKDTNYFVVSHWMTSKLGLTGNELLTYAVVYGFTQDGDTRYLGSSKYLVEAIGCSKNTAIQSLDRLVEKGFVIKTVDTINGVNFNRYQVNMEAVPDFGRGYQKLTEPYQNSVGVIPDSGRGGIPEIGTSNNIESNIKSISNKESICISNDIQYTKEKIPYSEIIDYLNAKTGQHYRANTNETQSFIRARFREKFTLDDFKKVIDTKCAEWMGTDWEKYLRPKTLFGTKFESYLNQKPTTSFQNSPQFNPNTLRRDNGVPLDELFV